VFEGFWQQDNKNGLSVFRQGEMVECSVKHMLESQETPLQTEKQNGNGIEIWSDGSYYHGNFTDGVKQGYGVYFWADGSRYAGMWEQDEMSGHGIFQWADGRRFSG
jgi:hypothetical protein